MKKKAKAKVKTKTKPKVKAKPKPKPKAKTRTKAKDSPTTRYPNICQSDWPANPGDPVEWQNVPPGGTTISQDGTNTWPFNLPSGFAYPNVATVEIRTNLGKGDYSYDVECCEQGTATKIVNVG